MTDDLGWADIFFASVAICRLLLEYMPVFTPGSSRSVSPDTSISTPDNLSGEDISIDTALRMFEKWSDSPDIVENTAKDIACLLHCMGKVERSIERLKSFESPFRMSKVYTYLLFQLKLLMGKPVPPISSRLVYVEVTHPSSCISMEVLRSMFPNMQKVWRILISQTGRKCLVEFASHSSARRAVDSRQQLSIQQGTFCSGLEFAFKCTWACPTVGIPPLRIDYETEFPIFVVTDDESVIAPSLDWRRPRPRSDSMYSCRSHDQSTAPDLLSILRYTGAFDDYPPQLSQLRF
jgi:hypothetical protein